MHSDSKKRRSFIAMLFAAGNEVRVWLSLNRRFAQDNNFSEHTAKISARLCLSSILSGSKLAPRYVSSAELVVG
jgi:hypothetical protein